MSSRLAAKLLHAGEDVFRETRRVSGVAGEMVPLLLGALADRGIGAGLGGDLDREIGLVLAGLRASADVEGDAVGRPGQNRQPTQG